MAWNSFRPYQAGDLPTVWKDIRQEDLREFQAVGLTNPHWLEEGIISGNEHVLTWDSDLGPLMVFGVDPDVDPRIGFLWSVGATKALKRWRFISRHVEGLITALGEGYLILTNYKDARNTVQIRWLQRIGFTFISRHEDFAGSGLPFLHFVRITQ